MPLCLAALLALAFALSRMLTPLAARLARARGFVDAPGGRKAHATPVPLGGGLAVLAALCATIALSAGAALRWPETPFLPDAAVRALREGIALKWTDLAALLGAGLFLSLVGLRDDRRALGPLPKLAAQSAAAAFLFLTLGPAEFRVTLFTPEPIAWLAFTILWVVAVTNAFNFIDNMDGLCALSGTLASLFLAVLGLETGQWLLAALFAALGGSLLGFLPMSLPPARIFLGDAGSLPVGFLIAAGTVLFTFYEAERSPWVLAAPALVLAVPLFDMATVLWIRLRERRPLMVGDRSHFSHRLLALGLTERQVLAVVGALSLALGLTATLLYLLPPFAAALAILQALAVLGAVWILERAGRNRTPPPAQ